MRDVYGNIFPLPNERYCTDLTDEYWHKGEEYCIRFEMNDGSINYFQKLPNTIHIAIPDGTEGS